ncbi:MAG TPA: glycosyltransferase family 39 protein [Candidatus Acidoferrum sp.]|nr:glycosyltransferase family 39 protein [Candidatus Acidoferrum sp.]
MSSAPINQDSAPRLSLWPWVYLIALAYFALHMATSTRYGYFRDALYYLACADHLAFGYVDQPPLFPFIAWIARHTLGTSLPALIFWPALAGASRIVLVAAFARKLGAKRFGIALAAALAATPAVWWVMDHQFAMNAFEALFWTGCAYVILRMIHTQNPKLWLAFGAIAGLGLENKYSIAIFAFALLLGLLLTQHRKLLFTPWLFAGGAVSLLIFLPNLIWNIQHHWPFLELMHNIRVTGKDIAYPPGAYTVQQILMMNPFSFPFWFRGLLFYLFSRATKNYRVFGWAFVITFAFFLFSHGKDYYSAPAYPILLAAGAVFADHLLSSTVERPSKWRAALKPVCFAWLAAGVSLILPLVLPVLPLEAFIRYKSHFPVEGKPTERSLVGTPLPQYYADELPWQEQVDAVARVFHSLSPEEQGKTAIFCGNYGQAAAIDFFGSRYGLPKAISGHQNYFLWGPRKYTGEIMIVVGQPEEDVRQYFASVEAAATVNVPYAYSYETWPILLCRGLKGNLQALWPGVKNWR